MSSNVNSARFFKNKIQAVERRIINKKEQDEILNQKQAKKLYSQEKSEIIVNSLNQVRIVQKGQQKNSQTNLDNDSDFVSIGRKLGLNQEMNK